MEDPLLTKVDVAERLKRSVKTVEYWRAMGTGPKSALIQGRVRYRQSDLERWIEEQFTGSHGETAAIR